MRSIFVFLLSIFSFSLASNADDQTVRLTIGDWKPFIEQRDEAAHGIAVSVVEAAFQESDYSVEWGFFPWARAYALSEVGSWDGSAVWYHSEKRAEGFLYSDPVFTFQQALVCHNDTDPNWETFEDLLSRRIGSLFFNEHPHIGNFLKDANKPPQLFPSYRTLYNSLASNRIDCIIIHPVAHKYFLDEFFPDQVIPLRIASKEFPPAHLSLIVSKRAKNAERLIESFNQGLRNIRTSGLYTEIVTQFPYFTAENLPLE